MIRKNHSITFLAGRYITRLFAKQLSDDLVFHNFHHTSNVVRGIKAIGRHLHLGKEEREILLLAAWFHDSGHIVKYIGHEEVSQQIAAEWLEKENYPKVKIEKVLSCIAVTHLPQQPKNLLEEVICDADLYHLSLGEYCHIQFQLREEFRRVFNKEYTDSQWMEENLKFLDQHQFFTDFGKTVLAEKKEKNKAKCKQLYDEGIVNFQLLRDCRVIPKSKIEKGRI